MTDQATKARWRREAEEMREKLFRREDYEDDAPIIGPYAPVEDAYLRRYFRSLSDDIIAAELGRSAASVGNRRHKLGLRREARRAMPWTWEHDEYLRQNIGIRTSEQIASDLGRTVHAVNRRRKQLRHKRS